MPLLVLVKQIDIQHLVMSCCVSVSRNHDVCGGVTAAVHIGILVVTRRIRHTGYRLSPDAIIIHHHHRHLPC
jgi:hypothetical protein